jgi:hypothetical protein
VKLPKWKPVEFDDLDGVFELPEFALRSTLGDLYRHTPLDPTARRVK